MQKYEDRGRGWSYTVASQETLRANRSKGEARTKSSLDSLEGGCPCQHLDLRFLAFKTVREYICAVCVCMVFKPLSLWEFVTEALGN